MTANIFQIGELMAGQQETGAAFLIELDQQQDFVYPSGIESVERLVQNNQISSEISACAIEARRLLPSDKVLIGKWLNWHSPNSFSSSSGCRFACLLSMRACWRHCQRSG